MLERQGLCVKIPYKGKTYFEKAQRRCTGGNTPQSVWSPVHRRHGRRIFLKKRVLLLLAAALLVAAGCQKEQGKTAEEETLKPVEQEEETGIKEYDVTLSGNLWDFQFAIDGETMSLPSGMKEWKEKGWEYSEEKEENLLDTESYIEGETLTKGEASILVDFVNLEGESKAIQECYVGGAALEYQEQGPVFQLPGEITLGKSVLNEVTEAYGTPTDEYEEKEQIYVVYEYGIYKKAEFVFRLQDEVLYKASMKNYREPENEKEEISKEEPQAVKNYQKPEGFSDNPLDYVVQYAGDFYKIPAPVSAFTENGWEMVKEGSDSYIKPGRHGYVTLEKAGQTLYAVVKNYGEKTVEIQHGFVTNVSGDFDVTKVLLAVGNHITLGMTEEDMKILLGGSTYEAAEEEEGTSYYLYSDETKRNFIRIFVDKELKLIREIEVSNSPAVLDGSQGEADGEESGEDSPETNVLIDEEKLVQ